MTDTFLLKIIARKPKPDSLDSYLYARITLNQVRREIGLKIKVENSKWNSKAQSLKGTTEQVKLINQFFSTITRRNIFSSIY